MDTVVAFHRAAGPFIDEGLSPMERGQIGFASGHFGNIDIQDPSGATEAATGSRQMRGRNRRHKSIPSRRISPIKEVRALYALARCGIAWMKASSSYRISVTIGI